MDVIIFRLRFGKFSERSFRFVLLAFQHQRVDDALLIKRLVFGVGLDALVVFVHRRRYVALAQIEISHQGVRVLIILRVVQQPLESLLHIVGTFLIPVVGCQV